MDHRPSTSSGHRKYFDRLAADWDRMATGETLASLAEIVSGLGIALGSVVLDMGTGTGVLLPMLTEAVGERGRVLALDISGQMLRRARAKAHRGRVDYLQADAGALPLKEASLDLIVCNACFPHLPDRPRALAEMARSLRPGGRLVICHTIGREAINRLHRSLGGMVKDDMLPSGEELRGMMAEAGFVDIEVEDSPDRYLATACRPPHGAALSQCWPERRGEPVEPHIEVSEGAVLSLSKDGAGRVGSDLELARRLLGEGGLAFVLAKEGRVLASSKEEGVRPFFEVVASTGGELKGAVLADRVVGRAVALLCLYAGIAAVSTPLASEPALRMLEPAIKTHADRVVPHILNRAGTGLCPFEALTAAIDTPEEAIVALRRFFERAGR